MESKSKILIVDNEAGVRESMKMILSPLYDIQTASTGEDALEKLAAYSFDLVTLDVDMPGLKGTDVLRIIREDNLSDSEIIIITGCGTVETAVQAIRYGVSDYLLKPFEISEILSVVARSIERKKRYDNLQGFCRKLGEKSLESTENNFILERLTSPAFKDEMRKIMHRFTMADNGLGRCGMNSKKGCLDLVRLLANTLEKKDPYTHGHSTRVNYYSSIIADAMNLDDKSKYFLQMGAFLHDIGKVGITNKIILKNTKLNSEDMNAVRDHCEIGKELIEPLNFPHEVGCIVRQHHEQYDGTGYPDGLKGKEISFLARIVSIVDSFDAMTSHPPYRSPMPVGEVINELRRCSGKQFDPEIVPVFVKLINDGGMSSINPGYFGKA